MKKPFEDNDTEENADRHVGGMSCHCEAMAAREHFMRQIMTKLPGVDVLVLNQAGEFVFGSGVEFRFAERLHPGEVFSPHDLFLTETATIIEQKLRLCIQGEMSVFEGWHERKYYAFHCIPLERCPSESSTVMLMIQDITERKQTESFIIQSENRYRKLADTTPIGLCVVNQHGAILYVNPAFSNISGDKLQTLCGRQLGDLLFHEGHPAQGVDALTSFVKGEYLLRNNRGENIPVLAETIPFETTGDAPTFLVYVLDQTEMKTNREMLLRYNEELRRKAEELSVLIEKLQDSENHLRQLDATKNKFFSIIAHDLKNPFNALMGMSEILVKDFDLFGSDEMKESIEAIYQAAEQSYNLLENLLEWSRTQTGKLAWNPAFVDLRLVAEQVVALLRSNAAGKKITLLSQVNDSLVVWADSNMINTVLRNLVTNAIKFTRPEGSVTIEPVVTSLCSGLAVVDTGIGIKSSKVNDLFSINNAISTKGTADERGTGLGLIICKEFVEVNGGRIWVESQPGVGSRFTFLLPRDKREDATCQPESGH